jgi:hypothetical protein
MLEGEEASPHSDIQGGLSLFIDYREEVFSETGLPLSLIPENRRHEEAGV